jgi:hypothetical protein
MATFTVPNRPNSTVLGIVQSFCREYAQPVPTGLFGSTDAGALQMLGMLQSVGEFCLEATDWEFTLRDVAWTAVASEDQGALQTLFPDDFVSLVKDTLWDLDGREIISGPVSHQAWAAFRADFLSPTHSCYVARRHLYIWPAPTLGTNLSATYKSSHWVVSFAGASKSVITADDDTPLLEIPLVKAGLVFYWKRAKELPYAVEEKRFLDMLSDYGSRNSTRATLRMDNEASGPRPGIIVPITGWGQ